MKISEGTNSQLMVTAAHRYCLGRRSYIVGSCIDWIKIHWDEFTIHTKLILLRDTIEALHRNEAGDECDARGWKQLVKDLIFTLSMKEYESLECSLIGCLPKEIGLKGFLND